MPLCLKTEQSFMSHLPGLESSFHNEIRYADYYAQERLKQGQKHR